MKRVRCVESPDQSLAEELESIYGYDFVVCDKFLLDDTDVTEFINGMYSPIDRKIYIKPNVSERTIHHEVCHAIVHDEHPELYDRYLETFDPQIRIEIEKLVEKCVRERFGD